MTTHPSNPLTGALSLLVALAIGSAPLWPIIAN